MIIGLAGGTGSGKSFSAMRLASGMSEGGRFCVLDTEAGRALHYADQFDFDHADLKPPFRPETYEEAILAADKEGYRAIVVDSMSHEWAGEGGILDWQDAELDRMAGDDWKKREACKMAAWIKPKMSHKHMVQRLLQIRAHLILCFRAEEKVEMTRVDGKMQVAKKEGSTGLDGWFSVTEKNLPYELTASFLLMPDKPGFPRPIKLQQQHRSLFPLDRTIDEEAGRKLALWSKGGDSPALRARIPETEAEHVASPDRTALRESDEKLLRDQGSIDALRDTYNELIAYAEDDDERRSWIEVEAKKCRRAIIEAERAAAS
jgi:hypothetical protein